MRSHVRKRQNSYSPSYKQFEEELKILKKFYLKHRKSVEKDSGDGVVIDLDTDEHMNDDSDEGGSIDGNGHKLEIEESFDPTRKYYEYLHVTFQMIDIRVS